MSEKEKTESDESNKKNQPPKVDPLLKMELLNSIPEKKEKKKGDNNV